jgi:hypothetical protein
MTQNFFGRLYRDHPVLITRIYRLFSKKRPEPYLRYLWFDLNKTKTGINHFKNTMSTTQIFFQKVIQGQMIVNFVFSNM